MDDHCKMMAEQYIFRYESSEYKPANAYLPRNHPYFIHHTPFADEQGRLIISQNIPTEMLGAFCITTAGNTELSWEFLRHLIYAISFPNEEAQDYRKLDPFIFSLNKINFGTPIVREYHESHMRNMFERSFNLVCPINGYWFRNMFVGMDDANIRSEAVERAISQRATLNEMEMSLFNSFVPAQLFVDSLDYLLRGIITPEAAAQRIQNTVSLWLMEQ
jgi:hypothetical protein